ncbi:MAG: DUF4954 family protein, partial [Candidatus Sumerlaeota bacterium]|nr:DUF4954 family protein [Candidatus Sumerlaeota bacterium]
RIHKGQALEFDALAPDSVEEIFAGLALLEEWTAKAALRREGKAADGLASEELRRTGRRWLEETPDAVGALEILGEHMENSKRPARILKAERGWAMYREMIHFYSMQTLMGFLRERGLATLAELKARLAGARREAWLNVGGQLMRASDVKALREKVVSGELATWDDVHAEYGRLAERYPQDKARHALASLLDLHGLGAGALDADRWFAFLDQAAATKEKIAQLTYESRAKDYQDGFRRIAYDSQAEMDAVLGTIDANEFVQQMRREAEEFARQVAEIKAHEPAPSRKR